MTTREKVFMVIQVILAIAATILPIAMVTVGIKHVLRASSYLRDNKPMVGDSDLAEDSDFIEEIGVHVDE